MQINLRLTAASSSFCRFRLFSGCLSWLSLCLAFLQFSTSPSTTFASYDLDAISNEMNYLSHRDAIISQNIANVDTPNYVPRDLERHPGRNRPDVALHITHTAHFNTDIQPNQPFELVRGKVIEIKPNGNMVNLQNEMMEKDSNALKYNELTSLYGSMKSLLRTSMRTSK